VRVVLVAIVAALLGAVAGGVTVAARRPPAALPPPVQGSGTLASIPSPPLAVTAETVRLRAGFVSHHDHPGPTFNRIVAGRVRITQDRDGTAREFGAGEFFFEAADDPHEIRVVEDAVIDVLRLLPPDTEETTELPE
jgi:quercetin dioxygenase-like cupin family protein